MPDKETKLNRSRRPGEMLDEERGGDEDITPIKIIDTVSSGIVFRIEEVRHTEGEISEREREADKLEGRVETLEEIAGLTDHSGLPAEFLDD